MDTTLVDEVLHAVHAHPGIAAAAVTGSRARGRDADAFSDLDLLLVCTDLAAVRRLDHWLPRPERLLVWGFHLGRHASALYEGLHKLDLTLLAAHEGPEQWLVESHEAVKGDLGFAQDLVRAAAATHAERSAAEHPDASLDNVLLLLATARGRAQRGETLAAHTLLSMAVDMLLALLQRERPDPRADVLDPRRRLEMRQPALAAALHEVLFADPALGVVRLVLQVERLFGGVLNPRQAKAALALRTPPPWAGPPPDAPARAPVPAATSQGVFR
jgi:predicted nucleotidyltransferase